MSPVMITNITNFLQYHIAGPLEIASVAEISGSHSIPSQGCKVDAPSQTVKSGFMLNEQHPIEHCNEAKQLHD